MYDEMRQNEAIKHNCKHILEKLWCTQLILIFALLSSLKFRTDWLTIDFRFLSASFSFVMLLLTFDAFLNGLSLKAISNHMYCSPYASLPFVIIKNIIRPNPLWLNFSSNTISSLCLLFLLYSSLLVLSFIINLSDSSLSLKSLNTE